jgi:NAD(P) transhydrogenase subunit alpha
MRVGIPNESARGERRVAMVPDVVRRLAAKRHVVAVEPGAGAAAHIPDAAYEEAGATVTPDALRGADLIPLVGPPTTDEIARLPEGATVVGFLAPLTKPELAQALAARNITSFAMEAVPRTTRAQSMDALSSQATVAGYRAALLAAERLPRFFPMLTTAAGTIRPAQVMVLGAGVAGLQAIATAKRLGALVSAFDVRAAVKEQIESLGASFVELDLGIDAEAEGGYARELTEEEQQRQRELLADRIAEVDAVITTAQVPGRRAPLLVTADAVRRMKPGSVIIDLAGESGGNCELTEPGQTVVKEDVTIVAPVNLPAEMPDHASSLYARNIQSFIELVTGEDGSLAIDWDDDIIKSACVTRDGKLAKEAA